MYRLLGFVFHVIIIFISSKQCTFVFFLDEWKRTAGLVEFHEHAVMHRDRQSRSGILLNNTLHFSVLNQCLSYMPRILWIYDTWHSLILMHLFNTVFYLLRLHVCLWKQRKFVEHWNCIIFSWVNCPFNYVFPPVN